MSKSFTFPAVAKFGNATTNQAKALALAAIELVTAMQADKADHDAIMATAKGDFGYENRDPKGQGTWRTFASKAKRVGADFAKLDEKVRQSFLSNERGSSLDSLFKALTGDENKAKRDAAKSDKEKAAQAQEQALREEIVSELGGKLQVLSVAEMMLHLAEHIAAHPIATMSDEDAGALNLLRDAINAACTAEVERLQKQAA